MQSEEPSADFYFNLIGKHGRPAQVEHGEDLPDDVGLAQSSSSPQTAGQKMQDRGFAKIQPGASGHSPGHQMQEKRQQG
ncbi:MAG: hypothetical protein J0H17_04325 [Rhizobiales bacterium]|nr:hypothetical protein [Hyphomicrobiales bacterium]